MIQLYTDHGGIKRPAGFISSEKELRVAQEAGDDYGKGIIVYHFELGKDKSCNEYEIKRIHPQDVRLSKKLYLDGMHTYNRSNNYEVIDIKTRRLNIHSLQNLKQRWVY